MAVLVAAGPAQAAAHLTAHRAIGIAAAQPQAATLRLKNPGAHWEAEYDPRAHTWTVLLEPAGAHNVLASFTVSDRDGVVTNINIPSTIGKPRLNSVQAAAIAFRQAKIRQWLAQYQDVSHTSTLGDHRIWTVDYYAAGQQVAEVHIADYTEDPYEVWTGPQVEWQLARGEPDAYGRKVNAAYILWPMCALFLAGLINWRRPLSMRTLDLVVVLSFVASLYAFNRGNMFWSTPLIYPPMIYLTVRMVWIGWRRKPREFHIGERHMLVLVGLTFALMGFRLGLNNQDSNVIDVGYAGVAGASTLMDGVLPYGHMPGTTGHPCHGRYFNGDPIGYVQTNGRCESPISSGDTYGPTVYLAYVPAVAAMGWSGIWDRLPAAHVAASAFDILAIVGPVRGRLEARVAAAGSAAGVRVGGQSVHALLAQHELQRRPRRGAGRVDAGAPVVPRRARRDAGGGGPDQVRAAGHDPAVRIAQEQASPRWPGSRSPRCSCSRCSRSTPTARRCSGTARSTTSSAG